MKSLYLVALGLLALNADAFFHSREASGSPFLGSHAVGTSEDGKHAFAEIEHVHHKVLHQLTPPKGVKTVVHLKEANNPVYLEGSPLHPDSGHHHHHNKSHGEEVHEKVEHEEEGHHEGHIEHDPTEAESLSLALFLMGTVGAIMFLFYLVNHRNLGIVLSTWRVLNMTVSIFVAVLLYGSLKTFILHVFEPSPTVMVVITLCLFLFFYIGTSCALWFLKGKDVERQEASGTILAHITGFAAMYGFADAREVAFIEELEVTGLILLIVVASALIGLLSLATDYAMQKVAAGSGQVDEAEEKWMEICDETDDDVFCLAISFLFAILFRKLIRGKGRYEPGEVEGVTQAHATMLLCLALGFMLLVGIGAVVIIKKSHALSRSPTQKRVVGNFQHLNSMIMAWSFLFWAEWQLHVLGWESTVIGACIMIAFFLSFTCFTMVFVLSSIAERFKSNKLAEKALGSLELALGVLVGFSWERAFDVGFEEVEHALAHDPNRLVPAPVTVALLSILLLVIVAPAWRYYIFTKVRTLEEKELKS